MAEVLAVVSGVAGLLSLAIEVSKILKEYTASVSDAKEDVKHLLQELQALKEILWQIDALDNNKIEGAIASDTAECIKILLDLREKLGERIQGSQYKIRLKRLTWTFSKKWTLEQVERLRRYLTIFQTAIGINTNKGVQQTLQAIEDLHMDRQTEKFKSILQWLSRLAMKDKHEDNLALSSPGTGSWFINDDIFQDWIKGKDQKVLWCPGDPGSGKTVMSAMVIDYLSKHAVKEKSALIFAYCDYKESNIQKAPEVLANLSKQLCLDRQDAPVELGRLASSLQNEGRRPNLQQAQDLLKALCGYYENVFIIVDAVDELQKQERAKFIDALLVIGREAGNRVFITSRPTFEDIQSRLSFASRIQIKAAEEDIRRYVYDRLTANESFAQRLVSQGGNTDFKQEVVDHIISSSSEM